jgi:hypothetical protein
VAPELNHYAQVTLNGSGSTDLNEDPLTYNWTWSGGSAVGVSPTISLFEGYTYTITLQVYDGHVWSTSDTCEVMVATINNVAPVVTAPEDIAVHADQDGIARVELTSFGYDPNSDPLTYDWSWSGGSASGQTIVANLPEDSAPPVEPKTYTVSVQAFDGQAYSQPDTCLVTVLAARPVADAGPTPEPVSAEMNHTKQVTLDGSGSYSRYGYSLTYSWSWPPNKTATGPTPTITLPEGQTTVILVVNDGSYNSAPDTVVVDILPVDNLAPVADAGADQIVSPDLNHRAVVQLDGTGSWDPNSDLLTYTWTWTDLGTQQLMEATGPTPQVNLYEGVNTITLSVYDGEFEVTDDVVVNLILVPNLPPVADAGPDQSVWPRLDRTGAVKLDGRASSDPNADPLTYTWTWTDIVTGEPKSEQGSRPTVIVPIGVTVISLVVNDGQVNSTNEATVTVTVTALHARVPSDFATVQAAIDFCGDGDTVVLERGAHSGGINFNGKAITVMGEKGWEDTTIDAQGGITAVTFTNGEGPDSRLLNVTITRGFNISGGAGIRIVDASPTIVSCRLTANSQGGAVYISGSLAAPRLTNLLVHANNTSNCGSAFWIKDAARPVITNCTVFGNASHGLSGALQLEGYCQAQFRDCLIWGNSPRNILDSMTYTTFTYCNVGPATTPLPGTGNIASDPLFVAGNLSEFYLKPASPCVNAGSGTVGEWLTEMTDYGDDVAALLSGANTKSTGGADSGVIDIGFHHHPEPIRILRVWITDLNGAVKPNVIRNSSYYFWIEYQTEGLKKANYLTRRTLNVMGPFSLTRTARSTDHPGIYSKQIGTVKKPITIPLFTKPPGYTSVPSLFEGVVRIKKANTTVWLGGDSLSVEVPVF